MVETLAQIGLPYFSPQTKVSITETISHYFTLNIQESLRVNLFLSIAMGY